MASSEPAPVDTPVTLSEYTNRVTLKTVFERNDGGMGFAGRRIVIGGWVKSSREIRKDPEPAPEDVGTKDVSCVEVLQSRIPLIRSIMKVFGGGDFRVREKLDSAVQKLPQPSVSFLQLSDGSCVQSLQVVVDSELGRPCQVMPTGTCILAEGILQPVSLKGKHVIELKADKVLHLGTVDQNKYPLTRKRLPLELLRDCCHFRTRTTTVASVMRIRSALTQATHSFFQDNEFLFVQVPVITSTVFEECSKKFLVSTVLPKDGSSTDGISLEAIKASINEKSKQIEELRRSGSNKEAVVAAIQDLKKTTELVSKLEAKGKPKSGTSLEEDKFDLCQDFFSSQMYLTVSGRLHLESQACALGNVYTYGPRFRAEKSESKKSLIEMWMFETEIAFSALEDAVQCAEDLLKFVCKYVLEKSAEDVNFLSKRVDKTIVENLQFMTSGSLEKISYTEAVEILKQVTEKKFESNIEWGVPLSDEHTSYLVDEIYKRPVIIYNHPKEAKPFYVRLNDDAKTVAAFDLLLPKVGTLVRGSQSEERLNILSSRIEELGLSKQQYEWYLDLRRHGAVKSSGFSLMLDSLVLFATGLSDIRDVVPFPISPAKPSA
ncbi:asparagine--tRNA ligase, cytoplasmic 2 [Ipomoea triloba]|uniref:asparagine--tRNA ligase, cytoplasmic 2 n=1 Tax=Ipomoea triloba TaxID=35885 RepID=UPI00125D2856|nr:asparagine--tRNA ligase, cytoplasmic 2 [Ipomoea triloba]